MKGKTKIVIQDHLDMKWEEWFDGVEICYDGNNTVLTSDIKDESNIHGILNQIRDLNLILVSINPVDINKL